MFFAKSGDGVSQCTQCSFASSPFVIMNHVTKLESYNFIIKSCSKCKRKYTVAMMIKSKCIRCYNRKVKNANNSRYVTP